MKKSFFLAFGLLSMGAFAQNTPWSTSGEIGIGTTSPNFSLEVTSEIDSKAFIGSKTLSFGRPLYKGLFFKQNANTSKISYINGIYNSNFGFPIGSEYGQIEFNLPATQNTTEASISFINGSSEKVRINKNGKVRIANGSDDFATPDGYRLFVQDGILTEKVRVAVEGTADWADYVFADNYQLMPLEDVEEFTKENKHLPNVPSAEEVVKQGLDVAQMDAKLLEKIEELTLYLIEQNKEIKELKAELKELKKQDKE